MKITADTPDLLMVEDRPIFIGVLLAFSILATTAIGLARLSAGDLLGLAFLGIGSGIGLAAFYAFVRRVQVVFNRPEGYVEIRRRTLFGGSRVRHRLGEISRAVLQETRSQKGGRMWRVALVIDAGQSAGTHPITLAYSNGDGHRRAAEAINRWLEGARAGAARGST
ncbi:MAG: hypothetical protein D6801_01080 [Alphaproteobacteria bacterium]|nr:MAG: hypothetical protein D6801_01080 [Alphaproteobacteria bacterium]